MEATHAQVLGVPEPGRAACRADGGLHEAVNCNCNTVPTTSGRRRRRRCPTELRTLASRCDADFDLCRLKSCIADTTRRPSRIKNVDWIDAALPLRGNLKNITRRRLAPCLVSPQTSTADCLCRVATATARRRCHTERGRVPTPRAALHPPTVRRILASQCECDVHFFIYLIADCSCKRHGQAAVFQRVTANKVPTFLSSSRKNKNTVQSACQLSTRNWSSVLR